MEPYPIEMRKRILADCDAGMSTQAVALKHRVCKASVRRLKQRRREAGEIAARKPGSPSPPKWRAHEEQITEAVRQHPDATLEELREALGLDLSIPTLFRALRALKLTLKKKSSMPRSKTARMSWRSGLRG